MPAISLKLISDHLARWNTIATEGQRSKIAKALGIVSSNLDKCAGLTRPGTTVAPLYKLLPSKPIRTSKASRDFDVSMERYDTLTMFADTAASIRPRVSAQTVSHLRQAALVLAMGSIDSYVRSFVIERYLGNFFTPGAVPDKLHKAWIEATQRAVKDEPTLLTTLASLPPAQGQELLATSVFAIENVRILTSNFDSAFENLRRVGVDIHVDASRSTTDQSEQFLKIARPIFTAFSTARHLVVHVGGEKSRSELYCIQQEPQRYLGGFLRGLVSTIEMMT